jgi:Polyketide cyclase / dehydrase and lipid transport
LTVSFRRQHDILIKAPAQVVYDIVSNPNSRPLWCEASRKIEASDRSLRRGERFREEWRARRGIIVLNWIVLDDERPNSWTIRADTDLVGPIVIRYCLEDQGDATQCIHHVSNPRRPSEPSLDQVRCIDEDIVAGLAGLKRYVEERLRTRTD